MKTQIHSSHFQVNEKPVIDDVQNDLNALGDEGWELVSVQDTSLADGRKYTVAYLKREKESTWKSISVGRLSQYREAKQIVQATLSACERYDRNDQESYACQEQAAPGEEPYHDGDYDCRKSPQENFREDHNYDNAYDQQNHQQKHVSQKRQRQDSQSREKIQESNPQETKYLAPPS